MTANPVPPLLAGLFDDAAVFPPGRALLPDAIEAYVARGNSWFAGLVGPLVVTDAALPELSRLLPSRGVLPLSVTVPSGPAGLGAALAAAGALPVELRSVEVVAPAGMAPAELVDRLTQVLPEDVEVYVEVPRQHTRNAVIEAIAGRFAAKLRTGGVRADMHPDEAELASALAAVVLSGSPFKATAGLHHAVRNTDPENGFEQHGFLNLLLATDTLLRGGGEHQARALLALRDGAMVAGLLGELDGARTRRVRTAFRSIGTCSITDPLADLLALGVLTAPAMEGTPR